MSIRYIHLPLVITIIISCNATFAQSKTIKKLIRGEIADGTSLSNIGKFSFENNSPEGRLIFKVCKVGDSCEITAEIEDDHIRKVYSVNLATDSKTFSETYLGGWTEDAKGCGHPLVTGSLSTDEYVFSNNSRFNFEGKCNIDHATQSGPFSWNLDETCKAPDGSTALSKARWSVSISRDTMIASISRAGSKPSEPFTLKRCEVAKLK